MVIIGGPHQAPFIECFFNVCLLKILNLTKTLFLNLRLLKKNGHTDRKIRNKQKLVLKLFTICINELDLRHAF